jgi:hypothetical protein
MDESERKRQRKYRTEERKLKKVFRNKGGKNISKINKHINKDKHIAKSITFTLN